MQWLIIIVVIIFLVDYIKKQIHERNITEVIEKFADKKEVSLKYVNYYSQEDGIECSYFEDGEEKSFFLCKGIDIDEINRNLTSERFRIKKDLHYGKMLVETKEYKLKNNIYPIEVNQSGFYDVSSNDFVKHLKNISPKEEKKAEYETFVSKEALNVFRKIVSAFEMKAKKMIYQKAKKIYIQLSLDSEELVYITLLYEKVGSGFMKSYMDKKRKWRLKISQLYRDILKELKELCEKDSICIKDKLKVQRIFSYNKKRDEYNQVSDIIIEGDWNEEIEVTIVIEASIVY